MNLNILEQNNQVRFAVKVVPGASRTRIMGLLGDALKVGVAAAAEKGKANKAVIRLLADVIEVSPNEIAIVAGAANPHKQIVIKGLSAKMLKERLSSHLKL